MADAHDPLDERCAEFYCRAMRALEDARVPFLVGGAFALASYGGVSRFTKDFDIFVRPSDVDRALGALAAAGYRTEVTAPHWLGKAFHDDLFVDVIWSSGNGVATVDDEWFDHAVPAEMLGMRALLVAPEEMIWQKAYIMERDRFDGADVLHIIHARAEDLDWDRLLRRFGEHWPVLLAHLILFEFAYPTERRRIPLRLMRGLLRKFDHDLTDPFDGDRITRATLLSRYQYAADVAAGRYKDARLLPPADLTDEDIEECA